jgi:hypothetical protein
MHDAVPYPRKVDLEPLLRLMNGLPPGEVLAVQREGSRGAFPPIARPAVTSLKIAAKEIVLVSRAATSDLREEREIRARFPRSAMLSASFAAPPRILEDLNRLFGARIDKLAGQGGSIALYSVDSGTFIPRPRGVIAMPATPEAREQLEEARRAVELVGEMRDTGDQLLVSFDRSSMSTYIKDAFEPATWPATRWALRLDPQPLIPILRKTGDSRGLSIVAPHIHRAARDLRRWIDALGNAEMVEAADSVAGGVEELRVRVASK